MTTKLIPPSAGDILRHAASLLEEWGSCNGNYVSGEGKMCEVGAFEAAVGYAIHGIYNGKWVIEVFSWDNAWPSYTPARDALYAVGAGAYHSDSSTHEERVAKLLEAAAYADELERK